MLSNLLLLPLIGAVILASLTNRRIIQTVGLSVSLLTFILSLWLWVLFDNSTADYQFVQSFEWLPAANVNLTLGIDGISLFFILLSTFAKAGATYVSPFLGRLDDISTDGLHLIKEIRQIYDNYGFESQILSASVRNTMHVINCAKIGSDVMTGPLSSITGLLNHPLTDSGLAKFLEDYKKGN